MNRRSFCAPRRPPQAGCWFPCISISADRAGRRPTAVEGLSADAFVHIKPDGKILITVNRLEFGQGVYTSLPMILADEMDADWSQVIAELAPAADVYRDPVYGVQMVGAPARSRIPSSSIGNWVGRRAAMLVAAAADQWKIAPDQCRTEPVWFMVRADNRPSTPNLLKRRPGSRCRPKSSSRVHLSSAWLESPSGGWIAGPSATARSSLDWTGSSWHEDCGGRASAGFWRPRQNL